MLCRLCATALPAEENEDIVNQVRAILSEFKGTMNASNTYRFYLKRNNQVRGTICFEENAELRLYYQMNANDDTSLDSKFQAVFLNRFNKKDQKVEKERLAPARLRK